MNVEEIDFESKFNSFFHDATSMELRKLYDVLNCYEEEPELWIPDLVVSTAKSSNAFELADVFWHVKRPFICWETFDKGDFKREFFTTLGASTVDLPEQRQHIYHRASIFLDTERFFADRAADGTAGVIATNIRCRRRKFGYYFLRTEEEKFETERATNLAFLSGYCGREAKLFVAVVSEMSGYFKT